MSEDDSVYEWDEAKRLRTIEKHGIDFLDLGRFFSSPHRIAGARSDEEPRFLATGALDGLIITVVFTERNGRRRIITARRARRYEREDFGALHAGGTPADEGQD